MSSRLRIRAGAGLALVVAALAPAPGVASAATAGDGARATVVVLQPGAADAATRAEAETLLTARAERGPVTVLVTSDPATVLVPPTRSQAALHDGLADPLPRLEALDADGGARAVLALATRLGPTAPSVVFTGPDAGGAELAAATARQAKAAGVDVRLDDLTTALRADRTAGAATPVRVERAAAVTAQAPAAPAFPAALVALAALFAVASAGLALRSRPVTGGVITGRIVEWTASSAPVVRPDADDDELDRLPAAPGNKLFTRIQGALDLTDLQLDARALVARTVVGTLVVAVVAILVYPPAGLAALVGVPYLVRFRVRKLIRKRRAQFADQLGDAVQAMGSAMRAGHGITSALSMLLDDLPEPAQKEFRSVVAAERIGVPLDEAIAEVAIRMDSRDLEQVGLVASLQRDAGGNGAEALDRVVETIRARDDVRRLITTLTAQGRMSRWVLTGMPLVLGGVLFLIGDGYMTPLFAEPLGRAITALACLMVFIGSTWMSRIVEIDV